MRIFTLPAFLLALFLHTVVAAPLVNFNDVWHYKKGTSAPQSDWKTTVDASLDASWLSGPGWIGFGDGSGATAAGTTLSDMRQTTTPVNAGYRAFYMRRTFTVPAGTPATDEIVLQTDFDDGFIAFVNGTFVDSVSAPGSPVEPAFNFTGAVTGHECSFGDGTQSPVRNTVLGTGATYPPGTYVLSIMCLNQNLTSSDAVMKANLFTQTPVAPPDLHWELAESPIILTATFNVASNQELIIDPGVEVRCHSASDAITCAGKITAIGTQAQPIRFVRSAAGSAWRRIVLSGTQESTFKWCDFDGANTSGTIRGSGTSTVSPSVHLENCRFLNTDVQMVELIYTSCRIINCEFDSIGAQELLHFSNMPSAGHALIKGCRFGFPGIPPTSGYNDIIDFTGGNRPGPIAQFIGNIFLACVDDCFDMDGTDAHIEGNIFLNVQKDASRSSSSNPITTGADGGNRSELVICRNLFYNTEHVFMEKDNGTGLLQNNTIVKLVANPLSNNTHSGGNEASGIIMFGEPWRLTFPYGDGAIFDGNIATEIDLAITDPWPVLPGASAEVGFFFPRRNNCIQRFLQTGAGNTGNIDADPMLVSTTGVDHTNILAKFSLQPGSPCIGTGPNGIDMGAMVPSGASISGQPVGTTAATGATVAVAGPGIWAYQWRLDGGAWSTEVSLVPASIWAGQPFTGTMFDGAAPITLTGLADGPHTLEVRGKNSAAFWQDAPYATATWTVQTTPPDTDMDGLPDAWELANGLNPNDPLDAALDADGDGQTNAQEFAAGTNPQDPASAFTAAATATTTPGEFAVTFNAVAGKSYTVRYKDDITAATWTVLQHFPVQTVSGPLTVLDVPPTLTVRRFYQVATPQQP